MPGIDNLTAGGPAGVTPSLFGIGVPALRAPIDQAATALAPPGPILTGPGLSWTVFGGAPFGAAAFAVRGPDVLTAPRLVAVGAVWAPAASVVVLRPTADPTVTVDTPTAPRIVPVRVVPVSAPAALAFRSTADPVATVDALPRTLVVAVSAALARPLPSALVLDQQAEPSDVRPPSMLVGQALAPARATVPVVVRLTADPAAMQPDTVPVLVAPRVVQPMVATPQPMSLATRDVTPLQASASPPVVLVARAYYQLPTVAAVATRATADPASTDTPTRSLVVQVLAPLAAAARAFVSTLLADQSTPSTAAPAPVVARVTTPTALPVPVLLRPTADPATTVDTLTLPIVARVTTTPGAAPAPTSTRSTTDPAAGVEQLLPRPLVVPITIAPAAAPRAAMWAPLAEVAAQPVPFAPLSVAAASRQWAPVPVIVRPVTDPAAPDAPPRLVLVTVPAALTTAPRPTWTRPAATLADALARPVVVRVGAATITIRVVLARSTYGDPPAARPGRITAGIRRTPTIDAGQTANATLDAGIRRNPSIDGS